MMNDVIWLLTEDEKINIKMKNKLLNAIDGAKYIFDNFEISRQKIDLKKVLIICEDEINLDYCNILKKKTHLNRNNFPILLLDCCSKYYLYMGSNRAVFNFVCGNDFVDCIILKIPDKYSDIEMLKNAKKTFIDELKRQKVIYLVTLNIESHRTPEENLGLYCLQNFLKQNGFLVEYIDAWLEDLDDEKLLSKIELNKALFVGISGCISNVKRVCSFKKLVGQNVPIVVGGYGGTFSYEELLNNGIDIISLGEGEQNMLDIAMHYLVGKDIRGINYIAYKSDNKIVVNQFDTKNKLFDAPCLERKYLNFIISKKSTIDVYSSKGCSGNCIFCSIRKFYRNNGWKSRENDFIFEEIKNIYLKGGKVFKFVDDSFIDGNRDNAWCEKFANKIKSIVGSDFRFRISIRADKINDTNISSLKNAGLFAVSCGIENFSISALKRMRKAENIQIIENALQILNDNKIYVQAGFILFDDETTFEEIKINLEYLKKYNWIIIKGIFSEMYAAPGTDYFDKLIKEGNTSFKNGNLTYKIKDLKARKVYNALHEWHILHQTLYDKLIDPISAPKALSDCGYSDFYNLYIKLFKIELSFFDKLCEEIDTIDNEKRYAQDYYHSLLSKINEIEKHCDYLYFTHKLTYTGNINIFL